MGFEDDFTIDGGGSRSVTVTRYALGARGIDGIETTTSQGSTAVYPVYDGHGNMIATLARASGGDWFSRQHERSYDAWGNVQSGSGGDQGYVANLGHRKDSESGLTYMRARYYEPGTGRFVSEDPARDGLNWYAYCRNSPISLVDYSGKNAFADVVGLILSWLSNFDTELGMYGDVMALRNFMQAMSVAESASDVEAGWSDFMEVWGYSPLGNLSMPVSLASGLSSILSIGMAMFVAMPTTLLGRISLGASVGSSVIGGIGIGTRLGILCFAYQMRIGWYVADIDE